MLAFVALLASCSPARDTALTLANVPVGKTWIVLSANYGTEEVPSSYYNDFNITFTESSYTIEDKIDSKFIFLGKNFPRTGTWNATATPSSGLNFQVSPTRSIFVKETSRVLSGSILNLEFLAEEAGKTPTVYQFVLMRR